MVGLPVDVKWVVVGFSVRHVPVHAVRQVEGDVKEIHDFLLASILILRPYLLKILQKAFLIISKWRGDALDIPRPSSLYRLKLCHISPWCCAGERHQQACTFQHHHSFPLLRKRDLTMSFCPMTHQSRTAGISLHGGWCAVHGKWCCGSEMQSQVRRSVGRCKWMDRIQQHQKQWTSGHPYFQCCWTSSGQL